MDNALPSPVWSPKFKQEGKLSKVVWRTALPLLDEAASRLVEQGMDSNDLAGEVQTALVAMTEVSSPDNRQMLSRQEMQQFEAAADKLKVGSETARVFCGDHSRSVDGRVPDFDDLSSREDDDVLESDSDTDREGSGGGGEGKIVKEKRVGTRVPTPLAKCRRNWVSRHTGKIVDQADVKASLVYAIVAVFHHIIGQLFKRRPRPTMETQDPKTVDRCDKIVSEK